MAKASIPLTATRLREILHYDPLTGEFYWKKKAGYVQTNGRGYKAIRIGVDGKQYVAARLAWLYMTGELPDNLIDHKNLNSMDNRWENLRNSSPSGNRRNTGIQRNNKTGAPGILWEESTKRWRVVICGKHVTRCRTLEEAKEIAVRLRKDWLFRG